MTGSLVRMRGVSKSYPGVAALRGVDFEIAPGEVRALLGRNGAGKSTLIKVMAGAVIPDAGSIEIGGEPVRLRSPADGIRAGIATVHQELSIVPDLTVAENIALGRWPLRRGTVDWPAMQLQARAALALLDVAIESTAVAGRLPVAERQLVEIARALGQGAKVLILDEPTSSLVSHEVEMLVGVIRRLAAAGTGIVYISHRMDEIRRVAHSVTVMRDGAAMGTRRVGDISNAEIVGQMLGEAVAAETPPPRPVPVAEAPPLLSVRGLSVPPRIHDASFDIRAGEVVGIAGVLGAGRTELLQVIAGLRPAAAGEMRLAGKPYRPAGLRGAMSAGVVMTPEDRRGEGAVTMLGIDENLVMASWRSVSRLNVIRPRAKAAMVARSIELLGIKLARPDDALATLSGGNQQKVVIGKALNTRPRLLLLDEPTRGVDIRAKAQLYGLIRDLAGQGLAVVFVSGEVEEFAEVCDRALVLRDGRISSELATGELRTDALLDRMMDERR